MLPAVAPVSLGASGSDVKGRLAEYIGKWAKNDRGGYAFGGMSRKKKQSLGSALSSQSATVNHLVKEAMLNGYSEKDAFSLVDQAVAKNYSDLYGKIIDTLPDTPDGEFDEAELARLLRQANRYGRFRKDMVNVFRKRLEKQNRWKYLNTATRNRVKAILNEKAGRSGYRSDKLEAVGKPLTFDY